MKENLLTERKIRAYIKANRIFIKRKNKEEPEIYGDPDPIEHCPFKNRHNYCHYLFPKYKEHMEEYDECPCRIMKEETVLKRTKEIMDK